jgi:hypothetical protein
LKLKAADVRKPLFKDKTAGLTVAVCAQKLASSPVQNARDARSIEHFASGLAG